MRFPLAVRCAIALRATTRLPLFEGGEGGSRWVVGRLRKATSIIWYGAVVAFGRKPGTLLQLL